jgi:hypothetical protein
MTSLRLEAESHMFPTWISCSLLDVEVLAIFVLPLASLANSIQLKPPMKKLFTNILSLMNPHHTLVVVEG